MKTLINRNMLGIAVVIFLFGLGCILVSAMMSGCGVAKAGSGYGLEVTGAGGARCFVVFWNDQPVGGNCH
jgi:hypothetical protein